MAESRQSLYIGSSDGLEMQTEATGKISQASSQGVQRVQQTQQQYFEGVIQNNNNIGALQQQLAQVELAGASRPSSLAQLSEGIVRGLYANKQEQDALQKQKAQAAAAQAKVEAENKKNTTLTKYTQALGDLTDFYESSNWKNGEEQYKRDAVAIVQTLPADVDPEIKKTLIENIYKNTEARSRKVGETLAKETETLRAGKVDVAKADLMFKLSSVVGSIASQSIDDQSKPFIEQGQNILKDFLNIDNGLPRGSKLSIIASAMDSINQAWSKKHSRYLERTEALQDWKTYASEYKILEAREAAGQISFDDFRSGVAALDFRYPGMAEHTVQRGDKEKRDLNLQQIVEAQRKLNEEAGARAISNVRFTSETVKAMVAGAFSDPSFYNELKNNPDYKDNPQFQEAVRGADRLQEYYKQENQVVLAQANAVTEFNRLDFSNLQTITSVNRGLAKSISEGRILSPTEQLAQLQINEMKKLNPQLAEALELGMQGKPIPQINQAVIDEALRQNTATIDNIKRSINQEIQVKREALYREFADLRNYGFVGQSQENVRAYAKNSSDFLGKDLERINRARQEAIQLQQNSSQYGLQPNFNLSSSYATSVDGNGRIKVVPRSRAQLIRLPDSTSVVTPIIAGTSAPVTSHWHDNRPGGRKHAGVDFGASQGARAIALVPGTVVHVGKDPSGYGGYVDLLGDNGVLYRYGHQAAQVKVGQKLQAGDVVSVSDGSGAGAPHLHFEVRPNPGFTNGKYDVSKNFGEQGTVEVLEHLQKLTAGNSSVLTPRFNSSAFRQNPNLRTGINSTLTNKGGAINGAVFQRQGGKPGNVTNRISGQRPMSISQTPFKVNLGSVSYDYNDHLGYAELAKDSRTRKAFTDAAKSLGVPTEWLVDIARQESGGINPYKDHDGNHYGLFGFGSDSLSDKRQYQRLRAGEIDAAGQLQMYVNYLKENGWEKVKKQKNNSLSIADLWAFTRMGWNMRHKFWDTQDYSLKMGGGLTYADELKLLGKWAGRSYALPGSRSLRSSAIHEQEDSGCSICQQLAASNTFAAHAHDNLA